MMEKVTVQRDAFVIRIWREAGRSVWQGWIQHVGTGEEVCVSSLDALTTFIESRSALPPKPNTAEEHLK